MHKHKILHRDIKPENIVLVHVIYHLSREMSSFVISGGQSTKKKNLEQHFVGLHSIYLLNCCKEKDMIKK